MCTVIAYRPKESFIGRNLDLEYAYGEKMTGMPRRFLFPFRYATAPKKQLAMMGMAYTPQDVPLFYEAINESGLYMAGLNFPNEAVYQPLARDKVSVAPFELIPWVLTQCETVSQAKVLLRRTTVAAIPYSRALPLTPLHWFVADERESMAAEPMADGLRVMEDPADVLTNSPPLPFHLTRLAEYTALSPDAPGEMFGDLPVSLYSRGMGTLGLPGDFSSMSRFVKAAYVRRFAVCDGSTAQSVSQMFHMLDAVAHPRGCVRMPDGRYEITVYSSCCHLQTGVWEYRFYEDASRRKARMADMDAEAKTLMIWS